MSVVLKIPDVGRFPKVLIAALVLVVSLTACRASVSVSVSEGKVEPEAEAHYRKVWTRGSEAMAKGNEQFQSGVCNIGGDRRGCYDASAKVIDSINGFLTDLEAIVVPSRYQAADVACRKALMSLREGFELRNDGLKTGNDAQFTDGNDRLKLASTALQTAYEKFPVDARPTPPL